MVLKAIIFDFDGVIVETEQFHYQATLAALKDLDIHFTYKVYTEKYIGVPDLLMFPQIVHRYGLSLDRDEVLALIHKKQKAYANMDLHKLSLCSGVLDLVHAAQKDKVALGICTGAHRVDINNLLPHLAEGKLMPAFQTVVTSDDVKRTKPDPEGYLQVASRLGAEPEHCWVIEDTPVGIQAGKAAGMRVLAVCTTHDPEQLDQADKIVHRLTDVNLQDLSV